VQVVAVQTVAVQNFSSDLTSGFLASSATAPFSKQAAIETIHLPQAYAYTRQRIFQRVDALNSNQKRMDWWRGVIFLGCLLCALNYSPHLTSLVLPGFGCAFDDIVTYELFLMELVGDSFALACVSPLILIDLPRHTLMNPWIPFPPHLSSPS